MAAPGAGRGALTIAGTSTQSGESICAFWSLPE